MQLFTLLCPITHFLWLYLTSSGRSGQNSATDDTEPASFKCNTTGLYEVLKLCVLAPLKSFMHNDTNSLLASAASHTTVCQVYECKHRSRTYSLTILIPSDLAEPMMLLTTVSREAFLILKQSSWAFTWAISYTVLTDTIPAVSWPSHTHTKRDGTV